MRHLVMILIRPTRSSYGDQPLSVMSLQTTRTQGVRAVPCCGVINGITSAVNSPSLNELLDVPHHLSIRHFNGQLCVSQSHQAYGYLQSCSRNVTHFEAPRLRLSPREGRAHPLEMPLGLLEDGTALTLVMSSATSWLFARIDCVSKWVSRAEQRMWPIVVANWSS